MSAQQLLNHAIDELHNLKKGEKFMVKDLFVGYLWNRELKADRLTVGTLFLNYANNHQSQLKILEKTPSNQQRYEII